MNDARTEQSVLVTGGAGYIGSHTVVELLEAGYKVSVVDNLCNSSPVALDRVREISGLEVEFHQVDLNDRLELDAIFDRRAFTAVIHFAGLKAVGESTEIPLAYYRNNMAATVTLLEAMERANVKRLVFSSSCTVYGNPDQPPIDEDHGLSAVNPYGRTKLQIEDMLRDLAASDPQWRMSLLRYFNPVGAHPSGQIGEDPRGIPNNLMPYLTQVAVGQREKLSVFGGDYPTRDGTCIRDYIHVVDLAKGHLAALSALEQESASGAAAINLGTGEGYTVLEVVAAAARAVGREIPHEVVDRRPGDAVAVWADPRRAREQLGWSAELGLDAMCADAWRWQQRNPEGFES